MHSRLYAWVTLSCSNYFFCFPATREYSHHHFLQSTGKRSALGTVREAELYGGVLSSSLTREHLALTAEFLRGDECVLCCHIK